MATIDLIVLGMLKREAMSAYDLQKLVEYRNISKWVKISTPSIYKKVIQLEQKGYIKSRIEKEGRMPEKAVYSLTKTGENEFENLMLETSNRPINIFLDLNAVIVNLECMSKDEQTKCLDNIESNMKSLKAYLEENLSLKENNKDVPEIGFAVLQQQYILAQSIEKWLLDMRKKLK